MELDKRVDVHGHYFPPAYQEMLDRHHMTFLDGAPRPAWSEEIQLSYMERIFPIQSFPSHPRTCTWEIRRRPSSIPAHVGEKLPAALMEYFFDTTRAVTNMILQGTIHRYPDIRFIIPHADAFLPVLSDRPQTLSGALNLGNGLDIMGDLASL